MTVPSVCPSYGLPGNAAACVTNWPPAECFTVVHEESGLRQGSVGDAYDSSRVLLLDVLLPESRANGFLVALPGRDELLVLPVSAAALPFIPLLKVVADKNHKKAPYPISDEVYWIVKHHGVVQKLSMVNHAYWGSGVAEELVAPLRSNPHFERTEQFCRDYDGASFDPDYDTLPLDAFRPQIERVFGREAFRPA